MAMSTCRECNAAVSTEAATCPHCGVSSPARRHTGATSPVGPLLWFGGAAIVFAMLLIVAASRGGSPATDVTASHPSVEDSLLHSSGMAYVQCGEFVKRRLPTPATADFPSDADDRTVTVAPQVYRVASYVDYQNTFGATVRADFTCTVRDVAGTWHLDALTFTPR